MASINIKKIDKAAYVFMFPAIVLVLLFIIYPAVWAFIVSFKEGSIISFGREGVLAAGHWIGLKNYLELCTDMVFLISLLNTLYFGLIFIPLTMFASLWLAIVLNKNIIIKSFLKSIFFMPYVVSIVSTCLIFLLIFSSETGFINGLLSYMNIQGPKWLSDSTYAMPVVAFMSSWRRVGYFMLLYIAALQSIPDDLYEAASIDGTNSFQTFWFITWPMLKKMNLIVFILLLVNCFNIFQEIYVMTGGGPGDSTVTVSYLIYNEAFTYFRIGKAAAMSYVLFFMIIIISIVQSKFVKE